jgi:phosphoribosyl-AMP cyclohydrolase
MLPYDACSHIYERIVCVFHTVYIHNYQMATTVTFKIVSFLSLQYNLLWNKRHKTGNILPILFVVNGAPHKCLKAVIIIVLKILEITALNV